MTMSETLSAWMDGELQGDEGRFVSKRLTHDEDLQAQVSRWTDIGDALREAASRENTAFAPGGFLDRVRVAIDQERAQVHAPSASEIAVARERADVAQRSRLQVFKARALKPTSIAASVTLLAAAVVLLNLGSSWNNELLTSLTMQNAATPTSDIFHKHAKPPAPRAVNTRIAVATPARPVRVTTPAPARPATPRTVEQIRQANTVASTPTTVQSLPPRISSTFTHVKPNVVASTNDPFGLGNTTNNRVLSGSPNRAWPKSRTTGNSRSMNASFSNMPAGATASDPFAPNANSSSTWPAQMSLGMPRGE